MSMVYCKGCGQQLHVSANACPKCGAVQSTANTNASPKSKITALLLLLFLGTFGAHRFYVGKPGTAILFIFTAGGLLVWYIIDLINIVKGTFQDSEGKALLN